MKPKSKDRTNSKWAVVAYSALNSNLVEVFKTKKAALEKLATLKKQGKEIML